ncbi:unnamed protein product [Didymodactylos carnosus]|uniref:G-protein coupled receptors family 1 profile domain-containing protein n=1 Tax=Didymodactylos carnosus TaxID=1234261 RepID=A0A814VJY6_9BILA|nr:unnamed protein product [Didymodactylos carnosus]CAF1186463.1 unnamed protein product [Didymodactylos carnosus]CAF3688707.1 unnamed protein product [Didymodactylos carnosus]CAF3950721.1 unnamed protein product [Didymodactylos carnosus]
MAQTFPAPAGGGGMPPPPPNGGPGGGGGGPGGDGGGPMSSSSSPIATYIYLYGYSALFLVGLIGSLCSLFTFSRKTLRSVSTSILFLFLAASDLGFLFLLTHDFFIYGLGLTDYYYVPLCRFRTFLSKFFMLFSAWTLVLVSVDRWIRTRFPWKSKKYCALKYLLVCVLIVTVFSTGLCSHLLTPMFGDSKITQLCVGNTAYPTYFAFFGNVWAYLFPVAQGIVPSLLMLAFLVDMFTKIKSRKRQLQPQGERRSRRQIYVQREMFILMLGSIFIFFLTTVPYAIYNILLARHLLNQSTLTRSELPAILSFILAVNYAINFFLHCLTSQLFRRQFLSSLCPTFINFHRRIFPTNFTQTNTQSMMPIANTTLQQSTLPEVNIVA